MTRRSYRSKPKCTRYVKVSGTFVLAGKTGLNSFRFSGRLGGHKLSPAKYQLLAQAANASGTSKQVIASFKIVT